MNEPVNDSAICALQAESNDVLDVNVPCYPLSGPRSINVPVNVPPASALEYEINEEVQH